MGAPVSCTQQMLSLLNNAGCCQEQKCSMAFNNTGCYPDMNHLCSPAVVSSLHVWLLVGFSRSLRCFLHAWDHATRTDMFVCTFHTPSQIRAPLLMFRGHALMWAHSNNNLNIFRECEGRETKSRAATVEFKNKEMLWTKKTILHIALTWQSALICKLDPFQKFTCIVSISFQWLPGDVTHSKKKQTKKNMILSPSESF